jgi:hypothetical protein
MERGAIRDSLDEAQHPGFRLAASGLRLPPFVTAVQKNQPCVFDSHGHAWLHAHV